MTQLHYSVPCCSYRLITTSLGLKRCHTFWPIVGDVQLYTLAMSLEASFSFLVFDHFSVRRTQDRKATWRTAGCLAATHDVARARPISPRRRSLTAAHSSTHVPLRTLSVWGSPFRRFNVLRGHARARNPTRPSPPPLPSSVAAGRSCRSHDGSASYTDAERVRPCLDDQQSRRGCGAAAKSRPSAGC
eukprot:6182561-Pleurochrysis_carterae.AAC.1